MAETERKKKSAATPTAAKKGRSAKKRRRSKRRSWFAPVAKKRERVASRLKKLNRAGLTLTLDEAVERDMLLLNNPVLVQGLALTTAVACTTTVIGAAETCLMLLLLITPARLLGNFIANRLPNGLKAPALVLISCIIFAPALYITNLFFPTNALRTGIYLPLLAVDAVIISRSSPEGEDVAASLRNGAVITLGCALVIMFTGLVRELLGAGKISGRVVFESAPAPVFATVAGGLLVLALLASLTQAIVQLYMRIRKGGAVSDDDE